jgi:hypothetical protein
MMKHMLQRGAGTTVETFLFNIIALLLASSEQFQVIRLMRQRRFQQAAFGEVEGARPNFDCVCKEAEMSPRHKTSVQSCKRTFAFFELLKNLGAVLSCTAGGVEFQLRLFNCFFHSLLFISRKVLIRSEAQRINEDNWVAAAVRVQIQPRDA